MSKNRNFTVEEITAFYTDPTQLDISKFEGRVSVDKKFIGELEKLSSKLLEEGNNISSDIVRAFIAQYMQSVAEYKSSLETMKQAIERVKEAKEKHPEEYEAASDSVFTQKPIKMNDSEKQQTAFGIVSIIRAVHGMVEQIQNAVFNFQHAENTLKHLKEELK